MNKNKNERQRQARQAKLHAEALEAKAEADYAELQAMWSNLQKINARSTGMPELDKKLEKLFGPWGPAMQKFKKQKVVATMWNEGQKLRIELDLLQKYYRHNHSYDADSDTMYWVVSLSPDPPNYDEPCWTVHERDLKKLRIVQKP